MYGELFFVKAVCLDEKITVVTRCLVCSLGLMNVSLLPVSFGQAAIVKNVFHF